MTEEEYIKDYFNTVDNLTAICRENSCWARGEYPELEIGKTYRITHIGVYRSSSSVMLSEFPGKEFIATCFDLYENGILKKHDFTQDPRFWAPYLRKIYRKRSPQWITEHIENIAIPAHLKDIEIRYNVKVLLAVESGSRAWGFESNNSDWDVRFIYVHKPEWYFKVEEQRDVIEHMYEDDVDLAGWELKKALSLLRRSNPSLLEWFHSPKVYFIDKEFGKRIMEVENSFFNPIKSMYHYNRIYNKHNERYLQQEGYPMKRFLYYLRGVLACQWIETNKSIPPVRFKDLYEAMVNDSVIKSKIENLIELKKTGKECDILTVDNKLVEYAQKLANQYNESIGLFRPEQNKVSAEALDSILYDMVNITRNIVNDKCQCDYDNN